MSTSVLAIGIGRIMASEAVVALLGRDGEAPCVFPIVPPKGTALPAVTVNRLFERTDEETTSVVSMTCMAKTVKEVEELGAVLIEEIDGTKDFDFADLIGITFDKAGPDVTGADASRDCMFRQIEWVVTW